MGVMGCPHCEEDIDSLTRTGKRKYSCGQCNMVIKYDDIEPHLDEFNVVDKRGDNGSSNSGGGNSGNDTQSPQVNAPQATPGGGKQNIQEDTQTKERELIYQRGTAGLKQIKRERLKDWLANSEGVGAQTEQRILMVFDRNETVHQNPDVLYNMLDDELSASASYLNTMVQDIFTPEEEYSDLLESQGYTPWFNRRATGSSQQQNRGFGGPMNPTGNTRFSQGGGPQPQQQTQQSQQQSSQPQQTQESQSQGDDSLGREEAEVMMRQAMEQANDSGQRGALLDGLSDATDEAIREMASNVGGLAGTVHRVVDEALVHYARENPEWVIENMGVLQKVLGAAEDMPNTSGSEESKQAKEDEKVDNALSAISEQSNSQGGQNLNGNSTKNQSTVEEERNPDLTEDHLSESDFEPNLGDTDPMSSSPDPRVEERKQQERVQEENESPQEDNQTKDAEDRNEKKNGESSEEQQDGFDEIFGDIQG